ncbi:fructoselysine 6-kinase [Lacrimispora sp.]|uniref:fructoselysine 6-kinase n=2 Tax=Lacrimispora sp. TaxID=2719234 RepID=UPI00289A00FC|nr:fructoselysine 6-kinase [Lacrimispora sp.]
MMKVAAIGDNCIDVYERIKKKYPTGNVVDTGVNIQKLGIPVSIISTTGSDENGKWMVETLSREGLDLSHFKVGDGPTAITYMDMDGLDRVHGDYVEGVLEHIVFDDEDIRFAAAHDLVHTALWGKAEDALPKIRQLSGAQISFDYADRLDHELVEKTLPYVDYGFYSYHKERDAFIESYLKDKANRGMKVAVATFGDKGSLAYDGNRFYEGGIYPAQVVNTVGAGDSFIAGFLYAVLNGSDIETCLDTGAKIAAKVVSTFNPWEK